MAINVPFDVTQIAAAEAARGGWWGVVKDFIRRRLLDAQAEEGERGLQ